jgi:hypothetical protein
MGNLLIYSARRRFLHLAASAAIGEPCPGGDCIAVGHQGRSTGVSWSLPKCPQFAGIFAGSNAGGAVSAAGRACDSVDFGSRSLSSANPFLARTLF